METQNTYIKNIRHINISRKAKKSFYDHYYVSTNEELFINNEEVGLKVFKDKIVLFYPTIDYAGKRYKPSISNPDSNWYSLCLKNKNLKEGKFLIDEDESDSDNLVIYFEDKIES